MMDKKVIQIGGSEKKGGVNPKPTKTRPVKNPPPQKK